MTSKIVTETRVNTVDSAESQLPIKDGQVFKSELIEKAIDLGSGKQLSETEFARLAGFNDEEIDMLKLFWDPVFNGSWIYLSDEIILKYLTNATGKDAVTDFFRKVFIKLDFQEDTDYKQVTREHELVKSHSGKFPYGNSESFSLDDTEKSTVKYGNRKKFYIVTGETYKALLLSSRTAKGKQTRRYYIKVESLANSMKDYLFKIAKIKLENEEKEKTKYMTLYNQNVKKHRFFKFKKDGPCFYIIVQGLEYADGISRVKIGICGCKKPATLCSKCKEENAEAMSVKNNSIDRRLQQHRTLWPYLLVKFIVYTEDAELLEKCIKRMYNKNINPNGHEIIENIKAEEVIDQVMNYLKLFNLHSDEELYIIEDNIDQYNSDTMTHMKTLEEAKEIIEEKIVKVEDELERYKEYLKNIHTYTVKQLTDLLNEFKLVKTGLKSVKKDRIQNYLENKINASTTSTSSDSASASSSQSHSNSTIASAATTVPSPPSPEVPEAPSSPVESILSTPPESPASTPVKSVPKATTSIPSTSSKPPPYSSVNVDSTPMCTTVTKQRICRDCKVHIYKKSIRCQSCVSTVLNAHKRKVERPPLHVLIDEVNRMGYSATGRKYGVSDNAVRKWIKVERNKL